ncbi:MAG: PP2C family protein-serine/threonine phosphatase [candidate division KSB1 bacterium]|nr:PP2C family protein-serine/threonine phosphatase [candidate division KSB1 bacterium]MDZ7305187.1 PP2C family protein-serine/threonine phosphatase [candidate division KSB1 bacterium]MDZ7314281.1 PP2C family protein-serine/threonine phosphatase [candidate division KSB1 bacterium]
MDTKILQHFRENLLQKRQNLLDWLKNTPAPKKQIHLGPANEQKVLAHLQVLDAALAKANDQTLGLCQVCHEYVEPDRLEMDFTVCVCIDHYSDEQKRRLEAELELAHKFQKALLPQQLPEIPGLQIAAFSQPAEIVGGDYFDFFHFRDHTHGLAIADVMGKGLPASMLMASLQASLRILGPENDSPAALAQRLNGLFCHNIHLIKFITLFLGSFDPETRVLKYCNAGHNPPLLFRRDAKGPHQGQWLQPTGAAIGLAESFTFGMDTVVLSPGDILVLYTDGVTEAMNSNREEFGEARIVDLVRQNADMSAGELILALRLALREFTGVQSYTDDLTVMVAK